MPRLAEGSNRVPSLPLTIDHHDCHILLGALRDKVQCELGTLVLLKIARERDLTRDERFALPPNLRLLSRYDLNEQVEGWVSLVQQIQWLMLQVEKIETVLAPPSLKQRRERGPGERSGARGGCPVGTSS